jgi:hypothetical protein
VYDFIRSLDLAPGTANDLIDYIKDEWMCDTWLLAWIDGGRFPSTPDEVGKIWTTNNKTERMNKTIEMAHSGKRTVAKWLENLFGYQLARDTALTEPQVLQAGLATVFNATLLENSPDLNHDIPLSYDQMVRRNYARLLFCLIWSLSRS